MVRQIDTAKVIQLYQQGWSKQALATMFQVDSSVIKNRLCKNNIRLRSISESVKAMLSVDQAMREHTGHPLKYAVNQRFFESITSESAYVLGFLQADGYVSDRRVVVALKASDRPFLGTISELIAGNRKLLEIKAKYGDCVSLDVSSVKLAKTIQRWGIKSPKDKITAIHQKLSLNRDYWRGVIDGDGTLCVASDGRHILSLVGSRVICSAFLAYCRKHGCGRNVSVNAHKSIFSVHLSNGEAVSIADELYGNAGLYLPRKMAIYKSNFGGPNGISH